MGGDRDQEPFETLACQMVDCGRGATQLVDPGQLVTDVRLVPFALCSEHAFEHLAARSHSALSLSRAARREREMSLAS